MILTSHTASLTIIVIIVVLLSEQNAEANCCANKCRNNRLDLRGFHSCVGYICGGDSCCGCGSCNIFCCNCDGGCNQKWHDYWDKKVGGVRVEHLGSCGHRKKRGISPAQRFSDAMDTFAKFNEIDYDGDLLLSLEESRSYFTKDICTV